MTSQHNDHMHSNYKYNMISKDNEHSCNISMISTQTGHRCSNYNTNKINKHNEHNEHKCNNYSNNTISQHNEHRRSNSNTNMISKHNKQKYSNYSINKITMHIEHIISITARTWWANITALTIIKLNIHKCSNNSTKMIRNTLNTSAAIAALTR